MIVHLSQTTLDELEKFRAARVAGDRPAEALAAHLVALLVELAVESAKEVSHAAE